MVFPIPDIEEFQEYAPDKYVGDSELIQAVRDAMLWLFDPLDLNQPDSYFIVEPDGVVRTMGSERGFGVAVFEDGLPTVIEPQLEDSNQVYETVLAVDDKAVFGTIPEPLNKIELYMMVGIYG